MSTWITTPWSSLAWIALAGIGIYVTVIAYIRIVGIRAIAEMEAFDYATTVAVGTIIGGTATGSTSLARGAAAIGLLFGLQMLIGLLRRRYRLEWLFDNRPMLVVKDGAMCRDNLASVQMTEDDLRAKLREQGFFGLDDVQFAILETTGDFSVLGRDAPRPDEWALTGVRGVGDG